MDVSLFSCGKKTTGNSLSRMYIHKGRLPTNTCTITMTNKVHMHPHTWMPHPGARDFTICTTRVAKSSYWLKKKFITMIQQQIQIYCIECYQAKIFVWSHSWTNWELRYFIPTSASLDSTLICLNLSSRCVIEFKSSSANSNLSSPSLILKQRKENHIINLCFIVSTMKPFF